MPMRVNLFCGFGIIGRAWVQDWVSLREDVRVEWVVDEPFAG